PCPAAGSRTRAGGRPVRYGTRATPDRTRRDRATAGASLNSLNAITEASMTNIFSDCHRELQERYEARALADRTVQAIVHAEFTEQDIAFISERDFFFLSTVDPNGSPTVSYKGGDPGFVRVESNTLVFPSFDGNGMFLS